MQNPCLCSSQCSVAQGELSEAGALLDAILPSSAPTYNPATAHLQQLIAQQPPSEVKPALLTATTVKPLPPPISIQAFNAQLVLGGKDESLRKAADIFKVAANKMDSDRFKSEKYWADALKIRRANWGLVPAPLPPGVATGKGADKSSRDFMVTYGLEECTCSQLPSFSDCSSVHISFSGVPSPCNRVDGHERLVRRHRLPPQAEPFFARVSCRQRW